MDKLISLLLFLILVFDPTRIVKGDMDLTEGKNDDQDVKRIDEAIDDGNNAMDPLRNIGILRSTRSYHALISTGKDSNSAKELRPGWPDYHRNIGIMRSLRSYAPESTRVIRSTRSAEPNYPRDIRIRSSTRFSKPEYLRNFWIMRYSRSA